MNTFFIDFDVFEKLDLDCIRVDIVDLSSMCFILLNIDVDVLLKLDTLPYLSIGRNYFLLYSFNYYFGGKNSL